MNVSSGASETVLRQAEAVNTRTISDVLALLRRAVSVRTDTDRILLRDLLVALEENSFTVILLIFSLLLVSPLSAIPGATTLLGLTIASILAQVLLGRPHVWLPDIMLSRPLPADRMLKALDRLERPAAWLERYLRPRLVRVLTPPFAVILKLLVFAAALCAPLMEVIPASGTSVGAAIVLFSAGLLARDGVFVLLGACLAAILPVSLWTILG